MSTEETIRPTLPTLANPPYPVLSYGLPFYKSCAKNVKEYFKAEKPYIIASKTLSQRTQFLTQLQEALGSSVVGTWIGVPNHTPAAALLPIIEDARTKQADIIITIGGGSISDGAKLISFALANNVSTAEDLAGLPRISDKLTADPSSKEFNAPQIPVVCIPISLSGGEYSKFAGVTDAANHKIQYTHEKLFPSMVVLDPKLTLSTPMPLWLSSGVRSIDHCVEGFCSQNPTPEGDAAAKKAIILLVKGLLSTKQNPDDLEARLRCQLGSNLSMTLISLGIMKGASHGVGHQLGPFGVGHGETSCILLPAVCKYNTAVNGDKQKEMKDVLCAEPAVQEVLQKSALESSNDLGDVLRAIFNALGMPKSLKDVGVGADKLDMLAESCLDEVYVKSNPRPMKGKEDVLDLLRMVVE